MENKWNELNLTKLSIENIEDLFNNRVGAIRIKNFLTEEECLQIEKDIHTVGVDFYENVFPPIGKIGITQFEHIGKSKIEYFDKTDLIKVKTSKIKLHEIVLNKVISLFNFDNYKSAGLAIEKEISRKYFAGLIRFINIALLHRDFGKYDGIGWEIEKVEKQLAWNIFIKSASNGGEGQVFKRFWEPKDDELKIENSYGYDECLVDKCESLIYTPAVGDLVFFNSRNLHKVLQCETNGERITMSSFIGKTKENEIVFWS